MSIDSIPDNDPKAHPRPQGSQATVLVALAEAANVEPFHTPEGEPFAAFHIGEHRETAPIKSKRFRRYLARLYYEAKKAAPSAQAVQDALGVLEAHALYASEAQPVYVRLAEAEGAIYLDLGDDDCTVVKITTAGWEIITNPPVKFCRAPGMLPIPIPTRGGSIEMLYTYTNVADTTDRYLLVAWLLAALRPRGPHPVLVLHGEQGSAKSTTARVLRRLVDPNTTVLRAEPRDEHDLVIAKALGVPVCQLFDERAKHERHRRKRKPAKR
jgi:hypothetical protein